MHSVIQTKRTELAEICRQFHVSWLDLFGSATGGDFDPDRSDVDLLVEFEPDTTLPALHQYFGLKEAAEALFDRPVDLVVAETRRQSSSSITTPRAIRPPAPKTWTSPKS